MGNPGKPLRRDPEVGFFDDPSTKEVVAKIASANRLTIFTGAGIAADLRIPNWSALVARLLHQLELHNHASERACREAVSFALDFFHQLPTASIVDAIYSERFGDDALDRRNKDIAAILYTGDRLASAGAPDDALAVYVLRLAIAKRLAGCNVHIVTTNYDDSLEHIANTSTGVLSDLGSSGVDVVTNWDHTDRTLHRGVPVSHVHGFIPRDAKARAVVFSEQEYIEWDRESRWRDYLTSRLSNGVTLFVGTSLRDYNIAAMLHRFSKGDAYALLPVEDEIAQTARRAEIWPGATAHYATLRGLHLGVHVLRPDFYGQVCQFLNETALHADLTVPDYSTRLRDWWRTWFGQNPYDASLLVKRSEVLRGFVTAELRRLTRVEHLKAEVWVRSDPDSRKLQLYSSSQTVVLPGEGYWEHCVTIGHLSRYAAVSAFAARQATEGRVNYRNDGRWTHFLAVPVILPESPYYELPVGVMILVLHAPDVSDDVYFGDAASAQMRALAVRMKEIGQEFLRPISPA